MDIFRSEISWLLTHNTNITPDNLKVIAYRYNCFTMRTSWLQQSDSAISLCHQYFLIPIILSQYTPVSSWSNRPLLSGGDSSCSWVFCLCTGPKGESYTLQEGWQSVSPVAITLIWNRAPSGGYSHERTQTSSFSCKVY